jgi:hypothetical protein
MKSSSSSSGSSVYRLIVIGLLCVGLAGCASSVTSPAAVRLDDGRVLTGTTTASMSAGTFQVAGAGLSCSGNYDPLDRSPVLSTPFRCSDGRAGVLTVRRTDDLLAGAGTATLSDGTVANVAFGRLAADVVAGPPPASQRPIPQEAPAPVEVAALSPLPTEQAPAGQPPLGAVPVGPGPVASPTTPSTVVEAPSSQPTLAAAPASGMPSAAPAYGYYGGYGPRTVFVRSYVRRDGTYVRSHYRSAPRRR